MPDRNVGAQLDNKGDDGEEDDGGDYNKWSSAGEKGGAIGASSARDNKYLIEGKVVKSDAEADNREWMMVGRHCR